MRPALRLLTLACGIVLAACTTGETTVSGAATGGATGTTATGPTPPTAPTGPTASTAPADPFGDAVSIDISRVNAQGAQEAAFFSCDGVFGTWTYIFRADFGGGIAFDIDADVDLSSGSGTLVFGDEFEVVGLGTIGWEDTVDLEIAGTTEAPTIHSTKTTVELTGAIEGFPVDQFHVFPENQEFPIVAGSDRC